MSYQYTVIVGHVGKDAEMRYTQGGAAVTSFSVAVTERYNKDGQQVEKTNWYSVACWGKLAEIANTYVKKGMQVLVTGTVEAQAYLGQDGTPRASLNLKARDIQFLSRADGGSNDVQDFDVDMNQSDDIPF